MDIKYTNACTEIRLGQGIRPPLSDLTLPAANAPVRKSNCEGSSHPKAQQQIPINSHSASVYIIYMCVCLCVCVILYLHVYIIRYVLIMCV